MALSHDNFVQMPRRRNSPLIKRGDTWRCDFYYDGRLIRLEPGPECDKTAEPEDGLARVTNRGERNSHDANKLLFMWR